MVRISPPTDHPTGVYRSPVEVDWDTLPLDDRLELLHQQSRLLGIDERIVDWNASLVRTRGRHRCSSRPEADGSSNASVSCIPGSTPWPTRAPTPRTARTAPSFCGQGGAEVLGRHGFGDAASRDRRAGARTARRTELPERRDGSPARPRPDDPADPRVDRAPARTRPDPRRRTQLCRHQLRHRPTCSARYQYGSELLNVTFDPTVPGQLASYGFDDDGTPAERQHLIENGILVRGLGGAVSQERSGLPGVANSRARTGTARPSIGWRTSTSSRASRPSTN